MAESPPPQLERYIPIARWLPGYPQAWLRGDLIGGITSWGVMVPIALAYASLAGVPPELGLTTAFAALAAYAIFGSSRFAKVTVSSTMAVMSAGVVGGLAGGDPATYVALTATLALIVGAIMVAAGVARLGFISDFLSKSVVTGFIFGLAITVIVGQIPKVLGVPGSNGSVPQQLVDLVGQVGALNGYTTAVGLTALGLILVLRVISRRIPAPLVALGLGIAAVPLLGLDAHGVSMVGEIATGIPIPTLPRVHLSALPFLFVGAAGIVFLAVGESVGAARAYAGRYGEQIDADQELLALGAANLSSGLFGGFAVDASLSQTATAEIAGARSQLASLVTSGLILLTALVLAPLFRTLPNAVLGAIVIASVLGLMDVAELRRYWAWRRVDFALAIVAMVGVVFTDVLSGMLLAVLLSLAFLLYRASRPNVAALGRLPGGAESFGDLQRHPRARPVPGVLIVRIDAPLYFFNANVALAQVLELVTAADATPKVVLLDLAATADLDVTTTDMLFGLVKDLRARSIEVRLAQVRAAVRDRMRITGLMAEIGEDHVYLSVAAAISRTPDRVAAGAPPEIPAEASADMAGAPAEVPGDATADSAGDDGD